MAPRLVLPALALGLLIAFSIGWLRPAGMKNGTGGGTGGMAAPAYRADLKPAAPLAPGQTNPLALEILDGSGQRVTAFDDSWQGREVHLAAVNRDLRTLAVASALPDQGAATGMMRPTLPTRQFFFSRTVIAKRPVPQAMSAPKIPWG